MTDNITEAAHLMVTVTQLMHLTEKLRALRDYQAMHTYREVTFADVVDTIADGNLVEESTRNYLRDIAEILDKNSTEAVRNDLTRRIRDAEAVALAIAVAPEKAPQGDSSLRS